MVPMNLKQPFKPRKAFAAATMIFLLIVVLSVSAFKAHVGQQWKEDREGPRGSFREDFSDATIDESIWTVADWREHGGQTDPGRCFLKDGYLHMVLLNDDGKILSSALQTKQEFMYGRWEARIKPSSIPGVLNSFYTIDWGGGSGTKQEIDIEFLTSSFGQNKGEVHLAVHGGGLESFNTNPDIKLDFNPSDDFHIWGFDIGPDRIEWFVDDKVLLTYRYSEQEIKIDSPYQLKLNAWTQKEWINGPPTSGVQTEYLIDWIEFTPYAGK